MAIRALVYCAESPRFDPRTSFCFSSFLELMGAWSKAGGKCDEERILSTIPFLRIASL